MYAFNLTLEQQANFYYSKPIIEASEYHSSNRFGFFTIGYSTAAGRQHAANAFEHKRMGKSFNPLDLGGSYRQKSFKLSEMDFVLEDPANLLGRIGINARYNTTDLWVSQGEFSRQNRQKINLLRIAVCWVDIDLYHKNSAMHLRSLSKEKAINRTFAICAERGYPLPSIIFWTGRGLCLKWYTDVLPKVAYPRWAAVQAALVTGFAEIGADNSARDASRLLRIPSTFNHKAQQMCEVIYVRELFGVVERVNFDDLANAVLPYTREQIASWRKRQIKETRAEKLVGHLRVLDGGKGSKNLRAFNPVLLAWQQVDDYRKIAEMRPVRTRSEGLTNTLVWMAASSLAVAVWADSERWGNEIMGLCQELAPHWNLQRIKQATATVQTRMVRMAHGDWVDWNGKKRPPVYTPRHATILYELGVTDIEAEQLSVIIPSDLAKDRARIRDRIRKELNRRNSGDQLRQEWLAGHGQEQLKPWLAEGISRATWFRQRKELSRAGS